MRKAWCILLLLPQFIFAQHDSIKARPYINISSGVGFSPYRLNKSANSQWMNYLKAGYNASLDADLPLFHSFWGIKASFDYFNDGYDMNKFVAQQQASLPQSTVSAISYGAFNQYFFMVGAFASKTFGKLSLEVWAQAGLEDLYLPNYEDSFVFTTNQNPYTYTQIYSHPLNLALGGGIGAAYKISVKVALNAHVGLLSANLPYIGNYYKDYYLQGLLFSGVFNQSAHVVMLNTSLGVSYYFN